MREELEQTRTEFAKAEAEVVLCEEREAMLMLEMAELDRQKEEITKEKEEKEREAREALKPRVDALNVHIEQLKNEIKSATDQTEKSNLEKDDLQVRRCKHLWRALHGVQQTCPHRHTLCGARTFQRRERTPPFPDAPRIRRSGPRASRRRLSRWPSLWTRSVTV